MPAFEHPGDRGVDGGPLREIAGARVGLRDLSRSVLSSSWHYAISNSRDGSR